MYTPFEQGAQFPLTYETGMAGFNLETASDIDGEFLDSVVRLANGEEPSGPHACVDAFIGRMPPEMRNGTAPSRIVSFLERVLGQDANANYLCYEPALYLTTKIYDAYIANASSQTHNPRRTAGLHMLYSAGVPDAIIHERLGSSKDLHKTGTFIAETIRRADPDAQKRSEWRTELATLPQVVPPPYREIEHLLVRPGFNLRSDRQAQILRAVYGSRPEAAWIETCTTRQARIALTGLALHYLTVVKPGLRGKWQPGEHVRRLLAYTEDASTDELINGQPITDQAVRVSINRLVERLSQEISPSVLRAIGDSIETRDNGGDAELGKAMEAGWTAEMLLQLRDPATSSHAQAELTKALQAKKVSEHNAIGQPAERSLQPVEIEQAIGRLAFLAAQIDTPAGPTATELRELTRQGLDAQQQLVEKHVAFAGFLAKTAPGAWEYWDRVQAGCVAMVRSAPRYDHTRGWPFVAYAKPGMLREMLWDAANGDHTIRLPVELEVQLAKVERSLNRLTVSLNREPSDGEIADDCGLDPSRVALLRAVDRGSLSLDAPSSEDGATLYDLLSEREPNEVAPYVPNEASYAALLAELKPYLTELQMSVLIKTLGLEGGEPLNPHAAASVLGISANQLHSELKKAKKILAAHPELADIWRHRTNRVPHHGQAA